MRATASAVTPGDVWRGDEVGQRQERVVLRGRLFDEDVELGPGDAVVLQGVVECGLVDDAAAKQFSRRFPEAEALAALAGDAAPRQRFGAARRIIGDLDFSAAAIGKDGRALYRRPLYSPTARA
jgi:hypothetical protein